MLSTRTTVFDVCQRRRMQNTNATTNNNNKQPQQHHHHCHRQQHHHHHQQQQQQHERHQQQRQQQQHPSEIRALKHLLLYTACVLFCIVSTLCPPAVHGVELQQTEQHNAAVAPPPMPALAAVSQSDLPHAAALAAPTPGQGGSGGGGGSSILERFSPNCTAVAHIFQARRIDAAEIPQKPSNEIVLRYCESPSVGTCCTYPMETRLALNSRAQLERHAKDQITKMSTTLGTKAVKFNENFRRLLMVSKNDFHLMFTRTYGIIYQQNSYVFSDLYEELENYYTRGRIDLMDVMEKFFTKLYQKMFEVLNAQYSFDESYLQCVSQHMKELKPFGDVPDKLSLQIKRSFVATRTYGQALATAAEVAKKLSAVKLNVDCTAALTKMQHCGACKGYTEKPCTNYCVNVIKGCLHYFNDLNVEWENFAASMDKVAERLLGAFNIVVVVEPINIKISEAIMNFQESGLDITNRVFQGCGRPKLGRSTRSLHPKFNAPSSSSLAGRDAPARLVHTNAKRAATQQKHVSVNVSERQREHETFDNDILDIDATLDDAIVLRDRRAAEPAGNVDDAHSTAGGNGNDNKNGNGNGNGGGGGGGGGGRRNNRRKQQQNRNRNDDNDHNGRDPVLDKMVRDIRQSVKETKKFWANLPHQICSSGNDEITSSSDVDGNCWNGHTIDRYMPSVTSESGGNPEFPGNPATPKQMAQVSVQLNHLKSAINNLRNAFNGQDVDWSDQEEPYYGSGNGSGGGADDEDDDEGSGLGGPPFTPIHKNDHTDHPAVGGGGGGSSSNSNNVDDEDTDVDDDEDIVEERTGGTQTSRPKHTGPVTVGGTGSGIGTGGGVHTNVLDENDDGVHQTDDNTADDTEYSGSGGVASTPQKMSLRRALLVYLLPLYMAWFGGICADLL